MDFVIIAGAVAAVAACVAAYLFFWRRKHNLNKLHELTRIKKHVHNHH
jgi:hypothetical protein